MEKIWDVIVVGAGPAGLTAGIYTSRHAHTTLLLHSGKIGGRALEAHIIENYPGFPDGLTGPKLMKFFHDQARKFGAEFKQETVIGISDAGEYKIVSTRSGYHQGKTLIIATGTQRKQLNIPGETNFKGRGVSYCATCDGPFFRDKTVAVLGSGYEAVVDALSLTDIAMKVYYIPGRKGYSEKYLELEQLKANPKVEVLEGYDIAEISGEEVVKKIKLVGGDREQVDVNGVFILLEHISTSGILSDAGITTNEIGCINVDRAQMTNLPGIYAAGDCTCMSWQIVTAAGEGAKAALAAMKYIKKKE